MDINFPHLHKLIYSWLITSGLKIVLIIGVAYIAIKLSATAMQKVLHFQKLAHNDDEYDKKLKTIYSIINSMTEFIIIAVAIMLILGEIGINIGPILATAGVVGVAIGFGAKRLVEDIITGFIILINDQIRVGDVVKIGDKSGFVEKLDLKMVVLRDIGGNVHFIRNGMIDVITNMTKEYSYALFEIGVDYKENIHEVIDVIKSVGEQIRRDPIVMDDILEPIEILGLDKFDYSAIIIKARIKTKPIKQWAVARAFNLILKNTFDAAGIEMPFIQKTMHVINQNQNEGSAKLPN